MDDRAFEAWEENIRKLEGLIERIDDIDCLKAVFGSAKKNLWEW